MNHTLSIVVADQPGELSRIVGLFSARGFNIETIAVGATLDPQWARVTIVTSGDDRTIEQIVKQCERLARVRAALRRSSRSATSDVNGFDGISVDFTRMEVTRDGQSIGLTAQEFKTLKFMLQNAERVISRDELLNEVWGYQNYPSTRTVDNHILKLRQKLEKDPANPVHFRTVHGMGYKFVP